MAVNPHKYHKMLAEYFAGTPHFLDGDKQKKANIRKCTELPWQQIKAEMWIELKETLCDLEFLEAKAKGSLFFQLIQDCYQALSATISPGGVSQIQSEISEIVRFLRSDAHILQIAPQLMFQQAANQAENSVPAQAAYLRLESGKENRPWFRWINKSELNANRLVTLKGNLRSAYCCAVSPDSTKVSIGGWGAVNLFSSITGESIDEISSPNFAVTYLKFLPRGLWMGLSYPKNTLRNIVLFEPDSQKILQKWKPPQFVFKLSVDNHGNSAAAIDGEGKVAIYSVGGNEPSLLLEKDEIVAADFSSDGELLVTIDKAGRISVYQTRNWELISSTDTNVRGVVHLTLSSDSSVLALVRQDVIVFINFRTTSYLGMIKAETSAFEGCAFGPDNKWLASVGSDGLANLWNLQWLHRDLSTGLERDMNNRKHALPAELEKPDFPGPLFKKRRNPSAAPCSSCAFSRNGLKIAIARPGIEIVLTSTETISEQKIMLKLNNKSPDVTACVLSPDASHFVWGTVDGRIGCFKTNDYQYLPRLKQAHSARITDCVFFEDGAHFITASADHTLARWNIGGDRPESVFSGHTSVVESCCLSPDNQVLYSVSADRTLRMWDKNTGKKIKVINSPEVELCSCSVSFDGSLIAAGDNNGSIYIWETNTCKLIDKYRILENRIKTCGWIAGSRYVLAVSSDGQIRVYDRDIKEAVAWYYSITGFSAAAFSPEKLMVAVATTDSNLTMLSIERSHDETFLGRSTKIHL